MLPRRIKALSEGNNFLHVFAFVYVCVLLMCQQILKGVVDLLAVKSTRVLDLAHQKECISLCCS